VTLKQAERLKVGALVRRAWLPNDSRRGLVLAKVYVQENHVAKVLCARRDKRYDFVIHWLGFNKEGDEETNPSTMQCWEVMMISSP
jgi:hypothetical protein